MNKSSSFVGDTEECLHLRVLPARDCIATTFETIANSTNVQDFQLIITAKSILQLLEEIRPAQSNVPASRNKKPGGIIEFEMERLVNVFSTIFERLVSHDFGKKQSDQNELPGFLDYVWDIHSKGSVDLMKTGCPSKILLFRPDNLDKLLKESLSSLDPLPLIPYWEKSKDLFMKIMFCLSSKFQARGEEISTGEQQIERDCLVEYTQQLLYILQIGLSPQEFHNLYPTEFHSSLTIEKWISDSNDKYFDNTEVADLLFTVIDALFEKCVNVELLYNFLPFFIVTHKSLDAFLRKNFANDEIRFETWPYLWQFCRKHLN